MKYYLLTNTIDTKDIGVFPQCDSPKSIGNLRELDYTQMIEGIMLPEPVIKPKAKATDYLKGSYINSRRLLLLSKDFLKFLIPYCQQDYQYWSIKVHHGEKILKDYFLFFVPVPENDNIVDYDESLFSIKKIKDWQSLGYRINVTDYSHYRNIIEVLPEDKMIVCDKLVTNFSNIDINIFRTALIPFITGFLISEDLKNEIEKKQFTGMRFKEIKDVDKRIEVIY